MISSCSAPDSVAARARGATCTSRQAAMVWQSQSAPAPSPVRITSSGVRLSSPSWALSTVRMISLQNVCTASLPACSPPRVSSPRRMLRIARGLPSTRKTTSLPCRPTSTTTSAWGSWPSAAATAALSPQAVKVSMSGSRPTSWRAARSGARFTAGTAAARTCCCFLSSISVRMMSYWRSAIGSGRSDSSSKGRTWRIFCIEVKGKVKRRSMPCAAGMPSTRISPSRALESTSARVAAATAAGSAAGSMATRARPVTVVLRSRRLIWASRISPGRTSMPRIVCIICW